MSSQRVDMSKPLPLGHHAAIQRGLQLRSTDRRMSYPVISVVMREYHGFKRSASWWQQELRLAGAEPRPKYNSASDWRHP